MTLPDLDSTRDLAAADPALVALVVTSSLLVGASWVLIKRSSRRRRPEPETGSTSRRGEDLLTFVAAALATGVAATGMWRFFGDVLHFAPALRVAMFAFLELAMFTSALRARRNVVEFGSAGIDGAAVWALTCMSAVFSAIDARSWQEGLFRLAAPLVAAWLWERGMSIQRRRTGGRRIHWRVTPERLLVRLGLAEATDRTASDVDAHRRLTRVARAAKRVRTLQATGAANPVANWRVRRAIGRLDRAMDRAVEHAGLATDQARQEALVAQLGALYNAVSLAELTPPAPWALPAPDPTPALSTGPAVVDPTPVEPTRPTRPAARRARSTPSTASTRPVDPTRAGGQDFTPEQVARALELDREHLREHGRPVGAERLRTDLSIKAARARALRDYIRTLPAPGLAPEETTDPTPAPVAESTPPVRVDLTKPAHSGDPTPAAESAVTEADPTAAGRPLALVGGER